MGLLGMVQIEGAGAALTTTKVGADSSPGGVVAPINFSHNTHVGNPAHQSGRKCTA